jgi:hypothetical protein
VESSCIFFVTLEYGGEILCFLGEGGVSLGMSVGRIFVEYSYYVTYDRKI